MLRQGRFNANDSAFFGLPSQTPAGGFTGAGGLRSARTLCRHRLARLSRGGHAERVPVPYNLNHTRP
jgi:hypothetical protein